MASTNHCEGTRSVIPQPGRSEIGAVRLAGFRVESDRDHIFSLSTLIESEIIPRLVIAHATDLPALAPLATGAPITAADVEALAPLALQVEADTLLRHVDEIIARGVTIDDVLIDLLAPTARLLGTYWEEDRYDFVDVTMALWRLQEIVHELAARAPANRGPLAERRRALFASMPGDQHSFGAVVIEEVFRREGWLTDRISEAAPADLLRRAADGWFDIIGLTVSCDCHIGALASIIVALRNVSRNPQVCVMVGGRIFSADPELAIRVGADGTARDARLAVALAARLVGARGREAQVSS